MSSISNFTHNFTSTDTLDNQQLASLLHLKIFKLHAPSIFAIPKEPFFLMFPLSEMFFL